jgi:hypothetical protein
MSSRHDVSSRKSNARIAVLVTPTGSEQGSDFAGNSGIPQESLQMALQIVAAVPELAKVATAWPSLPPQVRQKILALVEGIAVEAGPIPLGGLSGTSGFQGSRGDPGKSM